MYIVPDNNSVTVYCVFALIAWVPTISCTCTPLINGPQPRDAVSHLQLLIIYTDYCMRICAVCILRFRSVLLVNEVI